MVRLVAELPCGGKTVGAFHTSLWLIRVFPTKHEGQVWPPLSVASASWEGSTEDRALGSPNA
jgi:hypothetical protein